MILAQIILIMVTIIIGTIDYLIEEFNDMNEECDKNEKEY